MWLCVCACVAVCVWWASVCARLCATLGQSKHRSYGGGGFGGLSAAQSMCTKHAIMCVHTVYGTCMCEQKVPCSRKQNKLLVPTCSAQTDPDLAMAADYTCKHTQSHTCACASAHTHIHTQSHTHTHSHTHAAVHTTHTHTPPTNTIQQHIRTTHRSNNYHPPALPRSRSRCGG